MEQGYIKLHRSILDWEWYDDANTKIVWLHLLLTANYEAHNWHGITINRGQVLITQRDLAKTLGMSRQQIRLSIQKLISTHEITHQTTHKFSLITICNYESYQGNEKQDNPLNNPQKNQQTTQREPSKQPTDNPQNNPLTTHTNNYDSDCYGDFENLDNPQEYKKTTHKRTLLKEYKEEKNNNKTLSTTRARTRETDFVKPTVEEIREYAHSICYNIDADAFFNYYESQNWLKQNGLPITNWKSLVNVWKIREKDRISAQFNNNNKQSKEPDFTNPDYYNQQF